MQTTKLEDPQNKAMSRCLQAQWLWKPKKVMVIFLVFVMASVLFFELKKQYSKGFWSNIEFKPSEEDEEENPWPADKQQDKLLGGLLAKGLDEKSCRSRYQSASYHKGLRYQPSSHLISKLRRYEALHKRCGPYTERYNRTLEYFKSGKYNSSTDCKYVVWTPRDGLGNRIVTLASTFLYALLTNRILLVDRRVQISDLFCEPFPEVSWLVPSDFPIIDQFSSFSKQSNMSYGNMLKNNVLGSSNGSLITPYVYLHVVHDYDDDDKRFFCDEDQNVLQKVPWQILKSNVYFVPSLFLMPSFQEELNNLFPEKETVFHFLGRYLFHPTNAVWWAITRYYQAYLARADEKIGIQVRIFNTEPDPFEHYMDQILACVLKENILPQINKTQPFTNPSGNSNEAKAVLVTSLSSKYFETIKNMYEEHPTVTGDTIQVYQPSHEVHQHTENQTHNMNAWAEIYLLSLTDKLVTSSKSTFGYVAQSLGGLKPWILYRPEEYTAPNPACERALSMEPCFQASPGYDCKTKNRMDLGKVVPYIRHCEDMQWTWGLKLYGKDGEP